MDISIKKLKVFKDKRGSLTEILRKNHLQEVGEEFGHLFFVTFSNSKAIRGNHYHEKTNEFYIVLQGKIQVLLKDIKTGRMRKIQLSAIDKKILRIGPFIAHATKSLYKNTILLAYNSLPYSKKNPDTKSHKILNK